MDKLNFYFSGDVDEIQLDFLLERGLTNGLFGEDPIESLRLIFGKSMPAVLLLSLVTKFRLLNKFNFPFTGVLLKLS